MRAGLGSLNLQNGRWFPRAQRLSVTVRGLPMSRMQTPDDVEQKVDPKGASSVAERGMITGPCFGYLSSMMMWIRRR